MQNADALRGFAVSDSFSVGPIASVHYAKGAIGLIAETGAGALNLSSGTTTPDVTRAGGGIFANWHGTGGSLDASVQYVAGSRQAVGVGLLLEGAQSSPFTVRSPGVVPKAPGQTALAV